MPEAMKLIRGELGNDAVILNSKIIYTGGILGFFRKKNIEVIAAVDGIAKLEPKMKEEPKKKQNLPPIKEVVPESSIQEITNSKEKSPNEIKSELQEMKRMIAGLSSANQGLVPYPEPIERVNHMLIEQEIDGELREKLSASLLEKWYLEGSNSSDQEVLSWCKDFMVSSISNLKFGEITFSKKYVNVVGPTGVGKTTTLAKIAADCILKFNKKVAFITTDTYRIAAIEQLKTYAKILSIPLEVCYDLADFQKACEKFSAMDVVLIDTAGRNFRNRQYVEDLRKVVDYNREMETFLVLSLAAKQKDMEEIYQQFSQIAIDQFIFTKIDETSNYGSMYNMINKYQIGAAYITNGQDVPDDRIAASAEKIVNLVLGVEKL